MKEPALIALMQDEHRSFRVERGRLPYEDASLGARAVLVGPFGALERMDCPFQNHAEKRLRVAGLKVLCALRGAQALIFSSDMFFMQGDMVGEAWGIGSIRDCTTDEQRWAHFARVQDRLNAEYGGRIANLPRELRFEGIMTHMIGPAIKANGIATQYDQTSRGRVRWLVEKMVGDEDEVVRTMLQPWW